MFKVLVMGSYLDFIDTSGMICTQIRNLDPYLSQTGNNIVKFNAHVQTLIDTLTSRGQMNHVLLTKLFKAYAAFLDKNFVKDVADKQSEYEDGKYMTTN